MCFSASQRLFQVLEGQQEELKTHLRQKCHDRLKDAGAEKNKNNRVPGALTLQSYLNEF